VVYDDGMVYFNGNPINTIPYGSTFENSSGSNVVDVCVDIPNLLLWYRVNNGAWNMNGADPSMGIGGVSLSGMTN